MKIEDRIEAAAIGIYELGPYAFDFDLDRVPNFSEIAEVDRAECIAQAKAALKAAGIDELLEDKRKMREVVEDFTHYATMCEAWQDREGRVYVDKAKQILAQMGEYDE